MARHSWLMTPSHTSIRWLAKVRPDEASGRGGKSSYDRRICPIFAMLEKTLRNKLLRGNFFFLNKTKVSLNIGFHNLTLSDTNLSLKQKIKLQFQEQKKKQAVVESPKGYHWYHQKVTKHSRDWSHAQNDAGPPNQGYEETYRSQISSWPENVDDR